MHLANSDYDMKVQSTWEASTPTKEAVSLDSNRKAGSLCQRYDHKSSASILVSIQRSSWQREISSSNAFADKQESIVGSQSSQHVESPSFVWRTYFLSFPFSTWSKKGQRDGVLQFLIHQWQEWHSQRWQEKRQRQNHVQTSPGNLSTREKNSVSVKIMWILTSFAVLRTSQILRSVFESFASIQLSWTRRSMCRQLFIVRVLFSRHAHHMWLHWFCVCVSRNVITLIKMSLLNVLLILLFLYFFSSTNNSITLTRIIQKVSTRLCSSFFLWLVWSLLTQLSI